MLDLPDGGVSDQLFTHLTGRHPEAVDDAFVREVVGGRSLMITGAGGSVGLATSRLVSRGGPAHLVLVDRSEAALDRVERAVSPVCNVTAFLGDVRDRASLTRIARDASVDGVVHVAAHKHVPIAERQPAEYIRNNVMGTQAVLEVAIEVGVPQFLFVSTDKAVRPSGVMGATKWLAERLVLGASSAGCRCSVVRFGNVLGSSGSVLCRFREQRSAGEPLTITDPEMTRYFMTPTEAAYAVVRAVAYGTGGDVCSLDMGSPVSIGDLAARFCTGGGEHDSSGAAHPVQVVGPRAGEKTHEAPPEGEAVGKTGLLRSLEPMPGQVAMTSAMQTL